MGFRFLFLLLLLASAQKTYLPPPGYTRASPLKGNAIFGFTIAQTANRFKHPKKLHFPKLQYACVAAPATPSGKSP